MLSIWITITVFFAVSNFSDQSGGAVLHLVAKNAYRSQSTGKSCQIQFSIGKIDRLITRIWAKT